MSKNINSAAKYLKKEIERLKKESETWLLKESIAKENRENAQRQIEKLQNNIKEMESEEIKDAIGAADGSRVLATLDDQ